LVPRASPQAFLSLGFAALGVTGVPCVPLWVQVQDIGNTLGSGHR
jgi:hypothetical protein